MLKRALRTATNGTENMTDHEYCKMSLKKVSRTFAINIMVLRGDLYKSTLCAYLFCRIADTIEDAVFSESAQQIELLAQFRDLFVHEQYGPEPVSGWVQAFAQAEKTEVSAADLDLTLNLQRVINNYQTLPQRFQEATRDCIVEMTNGMIDVLGRKTRERRKVYFSKTLEELNKYCYYVAGTVGILLTRLFAAYTSAISATILQAMHRQAVSFGLGLQLTNIIKDSWGDYKRGWCYIPEELIRENGMEPEHLFEPGQQQKAQRMFNALIRKAAGHLDDALAYTLLIPRRAVRIRLFCLLPLFFAIATLIEAKNNPGLLTGQRVKISRKRVRYLIRTVTLICWNNKALRSFYTSFRGQIPEPA